MMDILSLLLDRGCIHLILKILSSLESWDLEVVGEVCHVWREILERLFWPHRIVRYHVARNKMLGIARQEQMELSHLGQVVGCGVVLDNTKKYSNMFRLWFLHSKCVENKITYFLDEWSFLQHFSRVCHCKIFEEEEKKSISCSDYKNGILAVGTEEGSILMYQVNHAINIPTTLCISVIKTHSKTVLKIVMTDTMMVSCSQDCSLTVVKFLDSGALLVSHVLQVHL